MSRSDTDNRQAELPLGMKQDGEPPAGGPAERAGEAGQPPESARRTVFPRVLRVLLLLLLAGLAAANWLYQDLRRSLDQPLRLPPGGMHLLVESGSSLARISQQLSEKGVLRDPHYLRWYARWQGSAARIKAGEFFLPAGINAYALMDLLVDGKVVQYSLTLVEGWNFKQMMQALRNDERLRHTIGDDSAEAVMQALGLPDQHPEGRFLPETYHFPAGTTDREFLRRAHRAMQAFLAREWPLRDGGLPLKSPDEALILASIIEKETGQADERARIAGVFVRRLEKRMRLQTDPTVIYGMGETYQGNIRRRDLKTDTPYNTYTRHGLPPTPIAMPGPASLLAALHPQAGEALYFVARGDGSHVFSETIEQHQNAVNRYQLRRRKAQ